MKSDKLDHILAQDATLTPDEYCREKAARSGSSFYYSFLFLPPRKRQAIQALYAFCREVDDIVDETSNATVAEKKLAWWREQIESLFLKKPDHPVTLALMPATENFNLPKELFLEIIDGMEMDLSQNRYEDFRTLTLYCYRVAGVVGELSAEIFGFENRRTLDYAHNLGQALQLTNIIRDVGEDALRNRIYLPAEDLKRFGVSVSDILSLKQSDNFEKLMAFQIERAEKYYENALSYLPPGDKQSQKVGLIMGAIYRALLEEIKQDPGCVLRGRTSLTPVRKLWIAWKTWIKK